MKSVTVKKGSFIGIVTYQNVFDKIGILEQIELGEDTIFSEEDIISMGRCTVEGCTCNDLITTIYRSENSILWVYSLENVIFEEELCA